MTAMNSNWKTITAACLIIGLVAFNTYVVYQYRRLRKALKEQKSISFEAGRKETALMANLQLALENDGLELPADLLLKHSQDSIFSLGSYMKGRKQVLVVRVSDLYCADCNNFILQKMGRLTQELNLSGHILYIGTFQSATTQRILRNRMGLDSDIMLADQESLSILPLEGIGFPYCFVLTEDLTILHAFVPDKTVPSLSNFYLRSISQRYFNIQ